MSASISPNLERPTFGVEVEFLIAVVEADADAPDPHRGLGLPPVLRIPQDEFESDGGEMYTLTRAKEVLDKCYGNLPPLPRPSASISQTISTETVLDEYRDWTVKEDGSIFQTGDGPYNMIGVEIRSPVHYASPAAFKSISIAISAIVSHFRCQVNHSCGLHVHVGLGAERMSLEQIRRFASLSYAIEPLLFTLHDPIRKANMYCKPLRDHSFLANEADDEELAVVHDDLRSKIPFVCHQYIGRDRRHGELPMSAREDNADKTYIDAFLRTRQPGHFEPFTKPGDSRHTKILLGDISHELDLRISEAEAQDAQLQPAMTPSAEPPRKRLTPRVKLPLFDLEELMASSRKIHRLYSYYLSCMGDREQPVTGVFEATGRIYAQPASCYVAELLSGRERPATNFLNYQCEHLEPSGKTMRTIEFRAADGSLDGEWIATWARICAGLFTFALDAPPGDFIGVLENCDTADREDGVYDVVDLLEDVGLFAEARYVEKRLMANRDKWRLELVE
ncbi:putative amidoligase enzyme-domain-containing protein [Nemania serpens]|nr:putative amidoligase enzyme-domain-containing protein [Nemania serpens]